MAYIRRFFILSCIRFSGCEVTNSLKPEDEDGVLNKGSDNLKNDRFCNTCATKIQSGVARTAIVPLDAVRDLKHSR